MQTREAAYDSRCAICDTSIAEGETVALLEGDFEWVHLECAEEHRGWIEEVE